MTYSFDAAIALQVDPTVEGIYSGHTHPAWTNMVGPFGGITAAALLNAVMLHPKRLGEPITLTVNFCAAVSDGPYHIQAVAARTNRSTQHWTITLQQSGETVITATAVTALRRQTWGVNDCSMPVVNPPETYALAYSPLPWTTRYQMRPLVGALPAVWDDAKSSSLTHLWVRDAEQRALDMVALAALCDVFFPRIYLRRAKLVPIGTVSLTTYFHCDAGQLAELQGMGEHADSRGYVLGQAQGLCFRNGFFDQTASVWSSNGTLLTNTHQTVYYKE